MENILMINKDIIQAIDRYLQKQNVRFVHVNSHTKQPSDKMTMEWIRWYGNHQADKLAVLGANK